MRSLTAVVFACIVAVATGCAHERLPDPQIADLKQRLSRSESERNEVEERVAALEMHTKRPADLKREMLAPRETPKLRVVKLEPQTAQTVQSPQAFVRDNDDEAFDGRPPIRFTNGDEGGDVTVSVPPRERPLANRSENIREAKQAYDRAFADVRARKFVAARDAFAAFLVKWPDHPLVANATYWRGECFFAEGDFARATEHFEGVLARFPQGAKASDALFQLGVIQEKKGDRAKARSYWDRLRAEFPTSLAAKRIPHGEGS